MEWPNLWGSHCDRGPEVGVGSSRPYAGDDAQEDLASSQGA